MTKSFESMKPAERASYENGLKGEQHVQGLLKKCGLFRSVKKGTHEQDVYHDIDLIAVDHNGEVKTISVKCNGPKFFATDFMVELAVEYIDDVVEKCKLSWFGYGKADYYAIYKTHQNGGGHVYLIDRKACKQYIATKGWIKTTQQSKEVAKTQVDWKGIKATHLGIVNRRALIREGICQLVADDTNI